ncbi:MAG: AraC family transcriptional regulator [Gemmatimonadaceae bacterium]|jgi:AraC-like DNA-binding protein
MGVIATLLAHDERLARLRSVARDRYRFVPSEDWASLTRACERGPVNVVVFDLYIDGTADFERVRQLRLRAPRAALVAYIDMTVERARDMFDAGRSGIDVLVIANETDSPAQLGALLDQAEARSVSSLLKPHLAGLRNVVRDALMLSVTRAHEQLNPDSLARLMNVSRRLLSKRLEGAELPPPHQLLTWGRLIVAASMLEDGTRSADSVAAALEFPSGSAFRNTCQRYLGCTPHQIRAHGGASWVITELLLNREKRREIHLHEDDEPADNHAAA